MPNEYTAFFRWTLFGNEIMLLTIPVAHDKTIYTALFLGTKIDATTLCNQQRKRKGPFCNLGRGENLLFLVFLGHYGNNNSDTQHKPLTFYRQS